MRHDNFIPAPQFLRIRSRGRLPHWEVDDAIYAITFRLKDSLPLDIARALLLERQHAVRSVTSAVERARLDAAFARRIDHHLDNGYGECILREYGETVANALRHFDGIRYSLHAWCVMPNHVHVMVHIDDGHDLADIVQNWKSYTAHVIKRGVIWQREYFDRIVRGPRDYADSGTYIRRNPEKAGLVDWPWVG